MMVRQRCGQRRDQATAREGEASRGGGGESTLTKRAPIGRLSSGIAASSDRRQASMSTAANGAESSPADGWVEGVSGR